MKIKLTYAGKRRNHKGQLFNVFVDDKGNQHNFGGRFRSVFIGYTYEAEKDRKGGMTISVKPKEVEGVSRPDDDTIQKWRALEACAEQEAREERVRKKADSMKDLLEEIPKIKKAMRGLTGNDQHVFMQWLWQEVDRENREKLNRELNAMFSKRLKRAAKGKK